MIQSVQDLIDKLELIKNKNLPVFIFVPDHDIQPIVDIDESMSDRIDLNIEEI